MGGRWPGGLFDDFWMDFQVFLVCYNLASPLMIRCRVWRMGGWSGRRRALRDPHAACPRIWWGSEIPVDAYTCASSGRTANPKYPLPPEPYERPPVILTCSGCCSWPPAQLGSIILGGWPSWGAPAPQTPRTWRLRRQQGRGGLRPPRPKWGGGGLRPPPPHFGVPCWRRRRQVRGVWGAGAPQEGQFSKI